MKALTLVARQHRSTSTSHRTVVANSTLDTWWRIVAHTLALNGR